MVVAKPHHANLSLHVCLVGEFWERALHLDIISFLQSFSVSESTIASSIQMDARMLIQEMLDITAAEKLTHASSFRFAASLQANFAGKMTGFVHSTCIDC